MKKLINNLFSDQYVNKAGIQDNIISLLVYRFAYPFALLLNKLHMSPNQITTQSLIFSMLAFAALVYDQGWGLFSFLWGIAVLLDFCDGTVARMANKVSKSAFRYDHMSDLFKIPLIILGVGLRYDDYLVWILALSTSFLFMYLTILNHDLRWVKKDAERAKPLSISENTTSPYSRLRERYRIVAWIVKHDFLHKIFRLLWVPLTTINGHTLLLFFLLPFGREFALWLFLYLIIIMLAAIRLHIAALLATPRQC